METLPTVRTELETVKIEDVNVVNNPATVAAFINLLDNANLEEFKNIKAQLTAVTNDFSVNSSQRNLAKLVLKNIRAMIKEF